MNKLLENFMQRIVGKEKEQIDQIAIPMAGELLTLEQVPDPIFAEHMMGEGFAINPSDGEVVAPIAAKVVSIFPTKHALMLQSTKGWELLIHIGIDTVLLKGVGFHILVEEGEEVERGKPLMQIDLADIKERTTSLISPFVFTKLPEGCEIEVITGTVKLGEEERVRIRS